MAILRNFNFKDFLSIFLIILALKNETNKPKYSTK